MAHGVTALLARQRELVEGRHAHDDQVRLAIDAQ
jgi:hypothetical protein